MRAPKIIIGVWLVIFSLAVSGCNLLPNNNNNTRPAPTRPKVTTPKKSPMKTPTPKVRPAPTKRTPGLAAITEKHILDRLTKIESSIKTGTWSTANKETNRLGMDMTKFRPTGSKGKSLRETANFNVMYAKLQADVKTKNKTASLKDVRSIRDAMKNVKTAGR